MAVVAVQSATVLLVRADRHARARQALITQVCKILCSTVLRDGCSRDSIRQVHVIK
jgi:phosphoribosyl-dephospho-CoA transferase